jgi:hypothetical protein
VIVVTVQNASANLGSAFDGGAEHATREDGLSLLIRSGDS